jgi:hypothetical protein
VILLNYDPVTHALIKKLKQYLRYALVVKEVEEALRLHDLGYGYCAG